jgi:multidrug efflux pump subunit AcrA (membrane-fusion protein)
MHVSDNIESRLRAEIEELKQRLASQPHAPVSAHGHRRRPSALTLILIGLLLATLVVAAFFAGYLPHQKRQTELVAEAKTDNNAAPPVTVVPVERSSSKTELVLPGNIQAITEAPVLARATGYIKTRLVDIGDRVKEGQLVAEIDAPELGHQVGQAKSGVELAKAGLEQANANLVQGQTNEKLYQTTAQRWSNLVAKGAVSRQDNDTYQAQYQAQVATVDALEKAVNVAKSNVSGAESNLQRLIEMQSYTMVRAPFAGVITQRNIDVGALVNEGATLLYRISQTGTLRIYVNVPQADASAVHVGQAAKITISDLPSRVFQGKVTRTADSLDPASRTLLAEVQVPNEAGLLMPGMYAQVDFTTLRAEPPLLIKGDALVVRANGPQVAIVEPDNTIHFQTVTLGRDYGDKIEILSGLQAGQQVAVNPGDYIQEHAKVSPVLAPKK